MSSSADAFNEVDLRVTTWQQGLADLVSTIYSSVWYTRGYDVEMRQTLTATLPTVSLCGVISHMIGRCQLVHINPNARGEVINIEATVLKELKHVMASQRTIRYNRPIRFKIDNTYSGLTVIIPEGRSHESQNKLLEYGADFHYCCIIYAPLDVFHKSQHVAEDEDFRHRERRFAAFPVKVSEHYWRDSLKFARLSGEDQTNVLRPPWEGVNAVRRTATLCLDMRKSTFCMEHSDQPEQFGRWMDSLIKVITDVCHSNGGVFDKFTGDGGLVHFLDTECLQIFNKSALVCAVECAGELRAQIKILLADLRKFIRFDSGLLGAGIAIDVGDAYWSLDYRDNPIVVGRVVVGACRICDGAKAGKIRLTNIARQQLPNEMLLNLMNNGLHQVSLSTKELSGDMDILIWEF